MSNISSSVSIRNLENQSGDREAGLEILKDVLFVESSESPGASVLPMKKMLTAQASTTSWKRSYREVGDGLAMS